MEFSILYLVSIFLSLVSCSFYNVKDFPLNFTPCEKEMGLSESKIRSSLEEKAVKANHGVSNHGV